MRVLHRSVLVVGIVIFVFVLTWIWQQRHPGTPDRAVKVTPLECWDGKGWVPGPCQTGAPGGIPLIVEGTYSGPLTVARSVDGASTTTNPIPVDIETIGGIQLTTGVMISRGPNDDQCIVQFDGPPYDGEYVDVPTVWCDALLPPRR